jgi:sulfate adenylyltransferase
MASSRKNKALYIDSQAVSALCLAKAGLLSPVESLMSEKESKSLMASNALDIKEFPFPFLLTPNGKRNLEVLKEAQKGDCLDLFSEGEPIGNICIDEIFHIDISERLKQIYGTDNLAHPGVEATAARLGPYSVKGEYSINLTSIKSNIERINEAKAHIGAKHTTAIMIAANPLHRGHERVIRQSLEATDLIVLFLHQPMNSDTGLDYQIRHDVLDQFISNYLPKNRVIIVPFETNYLFAGFNEIILDAIVAKNYGCDRLIIGNNHAGIGMYYDHNMNKSIIDTLDGVNIDVEVVSEFVYCNNCKTLVSVKTCPHGQHHHISYHSESILELMKTGLLPPAVLMRKELSSMVLAHLFPDRFKNLEKLYYDIMPNGGILEEHSDKDFYLSLMNLYQTTSLT